MTVIIIIIIIIIEVMWQVLGWTVGTLWRTGQKWYHPHRALVMKRTDRC